MEIKSFRDLEVWQLSMKLVERTYALSETFPAAERFGLTSQVRRAAVSIPSNVAEGHGRSSRSYRYHLGVARGSEAELQTQIELAVRLGFASREAAAPVRELAARSGMMLNRLIASLGGSDDEP
jgi:four helix bundle protein